MSESNNVVIHPATSEHLSDDALALRFAEQFGKSYRYVDMWSRWLFWDGMRWVPDGDRVTLNQVRDLCRTYSERCTDEKLRRHVRSKAKAMDVLWMATSDRRFARVPDCWDTDTWLLNTPGGVVDLRTGEMREHDPELDLTKLTAAAPGSKRPVTWLAFLDRVTGGDVELQRFLQRVAGYSLTGETSAHAMFFLYGTGANGKSVFIDTLASILGDYHRTSPIETFVESHLERHPTELAGLRGARLVTSVETEQGRRWAESRIKTLTGGDRISARFMRQDFFDFRPQFKLVIAGNHKPELKTVDEAIRRRFHMVPFAVTIPAGERDIALTEKLREEWPGILSWMIEGCLAWRKEGVSPPPAVVEATEKYLEEEDAISAWLRLCCIRDRRAFTPSSELFASYDAWSKAQGDRARPVKAFVRDLEMKGFENRRTNSARGFDGLRLLSPNEGSDGK